MTHFDALAVRGMDATGLAQLDLLSRRIGVGMLIGGDLSDTSQSVRLNMVTGPNRIAYESLAATPIGATEPAVMGAGISIDVKSTTRAGQISILATEKGAGVFHEGRMHAGSGGIQIDVNGQLQLGTVDYLSGRVKSAEVVTNGGPVLLTADSIR